MFLGNADTNAMFTRDYLEPAVPDLCFWNMLKAGHVAVITKLETFLLHYSYNKERKKTMCTKIYELFN